MLFPTFKKWGSTNCFLNNSFSFHVFFAFYAISNIFRKNYFFSGGGGGGRVSRKKIVVLASEPVGGRSRATELPCFILCSVLT